MFTAANPETSDMAGEPYPHFLKDLQLEIDDCASTGQLVPSTLRRFFLLLVRGHWASASNFGEPLGKSLGCLEWDPDNEARLIDIELGGTDADGERSHRIWIDIGNYRFRKVSFGNRAEYEEDNATEYHALPCSCQLLIRHEAPSLDVAYDMAWTTFCFLLGFTDPILLGLGGDGASFSPELVGEPVRIKDEPKNRIRVDVGARLDINLAVATTEESHLLKRVAIEPSGLLS